MREEIQWPVTWDNAPSQLWTTVTVKPTPMKPVQSILSKLVNPVGQRVQISPGDMSCLEPEVVNTQDI